MTLLAGATGIGYAVGSAVAGRLADVHGHTGCLRGHGGGRGIAAALLAAASQPLLRRVGHPERAARQAPTSAGLSTAPGRARRVVRPRPRRGSWGRMRP